MLQHNSSAMIILSTKFNRPNQTTEYGLMLIPVHVPSFGVIKDEITDHLPIFLKFPTRALFDVIKSSYRVFSRTNFDGFLRSLETNDFDNIFYVK